MNHAVCDVSRSLQRMFGLKFMIILMKKFNKVSHITFQPYKFRQGLRFTLFLISHRSQELWSDRLSVFIFSTFLGSLLHIPEYFLCIYLEILFKKCFFFFDSGSTGFASRTTYWLHQVIFLGIPHPLLTNCGSKFQLGHYSLLAHTFQFTIH
jgi:hypothetical protein